MWRRVQKHLHHDHLCPAVWQGLDRVITTSELRLVNEKLGVRPCQHRQSYGRTSMAPPPAEQATELHRARWVRRLKATTPVPSINMPNAPSRAAGGFGSVFSSGAGTRVS